MGHNITLLVLIIFSEFQNTQWFLSTHLSPPQAQAILYLSLLNTHTLKGYLKLGSCFYIGPSRETCLGKKPFSKATICCGISLASGLHSRLHFCLLVTFGTLRKKLQGTSQEVGIKNRTGLCCLYMTQPPPPLQSVWLHRKRKHQTQFPFFFWCQLKTKHAACDIFLYCTV